MRLYIDPGTGSMLFSLVIGLISVIWFGARKLYVKLKYLTPGKTTADANKKDIVIYGEDKRYWTSFKGILDEFERRKIQVSYLAGSEDDPLLKENYEYVQTEVIGLGNKAYARLNFLNARVVLATTPGLDVYQWKRSKDAEFYIHMTHSIGGGTAYKMFGTQFFDAVLLCSDVFLPLHRELEEKRGSAHKDVVAVGQTYMDYLLERKQTLRPEQHHRITVLVAPSWGATSLLNRFGETLLDALTAEGFDVTLRPHPQSFTAEAELIRSFEGKYPESERFHWSREPDNFNVLAHSDILISDFSGVICDYAFIFERPVLYAGGLPDTAKQDEAWLDEPYWGTKVLPQVGAELREEDLPSLGAIVREMVDSDDYRASIRAIREVYWQNRGSASAHVVDYIMDKVKELSSGASTA